ncbi:hypothetical protein M405DRAFT_868160 [Rhizopogon salebrosus TDB-379]|nr:hypothetical protein M405DRAFT_868160 [Rhizopogon salebrosus TDB-379]
MIRLTHGFSQHLLKALTQRPDTRVACSGSYFEYLAKYARLRNTDDSSYADAWLTAVDTSIKTLLRTSTVGGWLFLVNCDDNETLFTCLTWLAFQRQLDSWYIPLPPCELQLEVNQGR